MKPSWFRRYLLPGFVFQSMVIAGGYGTGREIVEFFLTLGPISGMVAMLGVSAVIWSAVAAVSFEFARRFRTFDYRSFFVQLLGPAWVLFEICYIVLMLLVLAVVGAAAGAIATETFGIPYAAGVLLVMAAVGLLLFFGSDTIERFLAAWSFLLYAVYIILVAWSIMRFGPQIREAFGNSTLEGSWAVNGIQYAGYNLSAGAVALFTIRHITTRREAVTAGLLTGPIGMLPAFFLYVAMVGFYPEIVDRAVPSNALLEALGSRVFQIVFQIVLFGTLIETGAAMIHAVNERVAVTMREIGNELPDWARSAIAGGFLLIAISLTPLGIIDLIASGYGTITWGFIFYYVLPVLTVGIWLLYRAGQAPGD